MIKTKLKKAARIILSFYRSIPARKVAPAALVAYLVLIGTFGGLGSAFGQTQPAPPGDTVYNQLRAEWQTAAYYKFNPDEPRFDVDVTLRWYGTPKGGGTEVFLQTGSVFEHFDGKTDSIGAFYAGLTPSNQTVSNWNCDGYGTGAHVNACRFPVQLPSSYSINPGSGKFVRVSSDEFLSREERVALAGASTPEGRQMHLKVIPAIRTAGALAGGTSMVADVGTAQSLVIEWDNSIAVGAGGPVADKGNVLASVAATDTNRSAVDNFVTGTIVSIVNIMLVLALGIVKFCLWLINSLIVLPIIRALLGGSEFYIASNIPSFVESAWIYVRDFMNLIFILVLIFAGVATMLRIEGYGIRKTIINVIFVALAVNFSLLAGQIVLNFAQILANSFVTGSTIDDILKGPNLNFFGSEGNIDVITFGAGDATQGTAKLLFQIFYEIGISVAVLAVAAFLLIRLVAIWLLLIVAPAAYILYLTEQGRKFLGQWWDMFLKYAFYLPIMAFLLMLISKMVHSPDFMAANVGGTMSIGEAVTQSMQGVMLMVMLGASLKAANKLSIYGADTIVSSAEKVAKFAGRSAIYTAGRGGGSVIDSTVGKAMTPFTNRLGAVIAGGKFAGADRLKGMGVDLKKLGKTTRGLNKAPGAVFKKMPLLPQIAKETVMSMRKEIEESGRDEARRNAMWINSQIARVPGVGSGLGAKQESYKLEILMQAHEFAKKHEHLRDTDERNRLFHDAGNDAERLGALVLLREKGAMPSATPDSDKQIFEEDAIREMFDLEADYGGDFKKWFEPRPDLAWFRHPPEKWRKKAIEALAGRTTAKAQGIFMAGQRKKALAGLTPEERENPDGSPKTPEEIDEYVDQVVLAREEYTTELKNYMEKIQEAKENKIKNALASGNVDAEAEVKKEEELLRMGEIAYRASKMSFSRMREKLEDPVAADPRTQKIYRDAFREQASHQSFEATLDLIRHNSGSLAPEVMVRVQGYKDGFLEAWESRLNAALSSNKRLDDLNRMRETAASKSSDMLTKYAAIRTIRDHHHASLTAGEEEDFRKIESSLRLARRPEPLPIITTNVHDL